MKRNLTSIGLSAACLLALLAGCASPSKVSETTGGASTLQTGGSATAGASGSSPSALPSGTAQSSVSTVDLAAARSAAAAAAGTAAMAAPAQRVVYFDFDSFVIKDEFKGLLDSHAKVLVRQGNKRMVVEGHTDERGGREYNLALGQKRAEAVLKSLTLLGVPDKQLEAVSFGEERPLATGSDESAWARNRRAELKDR